MDTLVVDSSVITKWLNKNNEKNIDKADLILEDTHKGKVELIAPELAKYEVGNVLLTGKKLVPKEANISLGTIYSLPITFVGETEDLAKQTFNLAFKHKVTYYDASFMSLAKQYKATLITDNIKHQGKSFEVKTVSLQNY
ncbi:type II toxin-antitoxin system VapC family toxin [Patescibacteria group bacterium]|nr:type II toxin-antitoxin system VapC family toxin [Patescibacteria group bacterium]